MPARTSPFLAWLLQQIDRDAAVGDLARDVQTDIRAGTLSRSASIDELRDRIENQGAGVMAALRTVDEAEGEFAASGEAPSGWRSVEA